MQQQIQIFTCTFDAETNSFGDQTLRAFCQEKKVLETKAAFFQQAGKAYWSVYVVYTEKAVTKTEKMEAALPNSSTTEEEKKQPPLPTTKEPPKEPDAKEGLNEAQLKQYDTLREWRRKTAEANGFPSYLVCTNRQIAEIIKHNCKTIKDLSQIKGFGKARIEKYGAGLLETLSA